MDQRDRQEDKDIIQNKIDHQINKWNGYCKLEQHLIENEQDQISTTDPDAKAVVLHRNIVNVGYNVQAVSDSKSKMIVALDTGSVNDTHALSTMVALTQRNLALKQETNVLADKGYHTASQLAACELLAVKSFVSPKANAAHKKYNVFPMEDFKYHPPSDTCRCPNNAILRTNGVSYKRNTSKGDQYIVHFKHYKTNACKECPIREQCTSSPRGRTLQRSEYQGAVDRNNNRVNNDPDYYRRRQQIIEHQFGTIKRQWGFTYTLMRGKENVLAEASMVFTIYNLKRSLSILGFNSLMKRLEALILAFKSILANKMLPIARPQIIFQQLSWSMIH